MIIIVGVAGAGKSVQSQLLAAKGNYQWLSIGMLLRLMITDDRRELMLEGKMLDDGEVIGIVEEALGRLGDKPELIIDGFPRSPKQAEWLVEQLKSGKININAVVHLMADRDIVRARLLKRGRPDDKDDAINERFKEYDESILPTLEMFKNAGLKVLDINGAQTVDIVTEDIVTALQ